MNTFEMMKLAEKTGKMYFKNQMAYSHELGFVIKGCKVQWEGWSSSLNDFLKLYDWEEMPPEWSKVEQGTRVLVRDDENDGWQDAIFIAYAPMLPNPFVTIDDSDSDMPLAWKYCKLA